ncbi:MAG: DNA recombination/repair protein RecA, partial [Thiovulaceae bacterium]|nr:DNA recombination/repair protein RecA [Sulfurimonadaceae bacterium]
TKAKVVKNKVAPPFKQAEFDIMFGEGISKEGELVDYGVKLDIIDKSGAWFSYGDQKLGQGREKVKDKFKEDSKLSAEIETKIKEAMGITSSVMDMDASELDEADL